MADVNSNININFNTAAALAQLRSLQAGLSRFHLSLAEGNLAAANAQKGLNAQLIQSIGATGKFSASQVKVAGSTLAFTSALEKNKLSLREYFRYTMAAATANTRVLGRAFAQEREIINRARRDRVKALQAQYIQMNKSNAGFMDAIRIMPKSLAMASGKFTELGTRIQYAAQRQQFLNQLLRQGSTQLLNFGKNTQWAGRQLMVGLTMPLVLFGSMAAKTFRDLEKEIVKFRRVYGDAFTNDAETDVAVENIRRLANEYTKYGVAVTKTVEMAATAAAAGFSGTALTAQVETATKLAVLGQIEQQQALETTISLQSAFGISSEELAKKIDFLNAVENQTLLSIEDLTIAIPKAAPVVKQLGGSVEDLAFFLTAMKEGGINASEGANALKSGLASLINPSDKAAKFLGNLGINIKGIVEGNKGDIKATVVGFADALDTLDPLNRARAIEQLFGKFQFSRLSTLFQNVTKEGTQASRAFDLAGKSVEELAILSEREMKKIEDSVGVKFQAAVEQFKQDIMPIGKAFLEALTPVVKFFGNLFEKFNGLSDSTKKIVAVIVATVAGIGPIVLMTFGVLMNAVANGIKLFAKLRAGVARLNGQTNVMGAGFNYMTQEQIENAASSQSLHQTHTRLIQVFNVEANSVNALASSYNSLSTQMRAMASANPALFAGGMRGATRAVSKLPPVRKYKDGILTVPGPKGAGDIQPAMLAPGEAVIPAKTTEKYRGLISAIFNDKVPGFMAGRIPAGRAQYTTNDLIMQKINRRAYPGTHPERQSGATFVGMPVSAAKAAQSREMLDKISDGVKSGRFATMPPSDFGTKLSGFKGYSFPDRGIGGVYRKPNGELVVVKPTISDKTALAEVRMGEIESARGMVIPKQKIRTMLDPTDPTGQRKFVVLESPYDPRFASMDGKFSRTDMVKQFVGSMIRADKDLQRSNVSGNRVPDFGNAGVFDRASGFRDYTTALPSMEQQAMINLLGIRGGAKKDFAISTAPLAANMTPTQYGNAIKREIDQSIPQIERLIKSWNLDPQEQVVYNNMLKRLKDGSKVDWAQFQPIHARAGSGVIKAETGIDPDATPSETKKQRSRYEIAAQRNKSRTQIDRLVRQLNKDIENTLKELKKTNPQQYKKAIALLGKSGVTPNRSGAIDFKKSKIYTDFIAKDLIYKDGAYHTTKAIEKGQSPTTSGKSYDAIRDQLLYRMGAAPKPGKETFSNKAFTASRLREDLTSTTQSGGWRANIDRKSDLYKALDKAEMEHKARNIANPTNVALNKLRTQMIADGYTVKQVDAMLRTELSHLAKTGEAGLGPEKWKTGFAKFDLRLLNSYVNPGGKPGQPVQNPRLAKILDWDAKNGNVLFNPTQTAELKKALEFIKTGAHPITESQARLVQAAANAQVEADRYLTQHKKQNSGAKPKGFPDLGSVRQAKAVSTLLNDRLGGGYYQGTPTIYRLGAGPVLATPGEYLADLEKRTAEKLSVGNTQSRPMGARPSTGKPGDNLAVEETPTKRVITTSQVRRGGFTITGRDAGDPSTTLTPYQRQELKKIKTKYPQMSESQLQDILRRKLKHEQDILKSKEKEAAAARKSTKRAELLPKQAAAAERIEKQRQSRLLEASRYQDTATKMNQEIDKKKATQAARALRQEKIGRVSGGMSMALGTAGMGMMMTGNMGAGMGLMGASAAAGLAPMLAGMGPGGWITTALVAFGASVLLLEKANKSAAQKTSRLADATSATTEKMKSIGALTGKVGASELYERKRRESGLNKYSKGFERGKQQFGTTFLESETGKSIVEAFTKDFVNGGTNAVKKISLQLSAYVSDGIMTAEEAHSVASQIGMNLNNQTLITQISGTLLELIGPGGKDLLKNPLEVRLNLVSEEISSNQLTTDQVAAAGVPVFDPANTNDDILEGASGFFDDYIALFTESPAEKIGATLGASFANSFEFNQSQMDSFAKYYDDQILILEKQKLQTSELSKQAVITEKISKLQDDKEIGLDQFKLKNKEILDSAGRAIGSLQSSSPGMRALKTASETQLTDKYKGTGEELASVVLAEKTKQLDVDLQIKLNAIAGGGIIGPEALSNMIDMFGTDAAGQTEMRKELEVAVVKQDPADVQDLLQSLGGFENKEIAKDVFVQLINKDPKTFKNLASTINLMEEMDGKEIDIEAFFQDKNALGRLEALQGKLDKVQEINTPITKDIIGNIDIDDNVNTKDMDGLVEIWDKFDNLPDVTQKTIISSYITLMDTLTDGDIDAEIARRIAEQGSTGNIRGAEYAAQYYRSDAGRKAAKTGLAQDRLMNKVDQDKRNAEANKVIDDTVNGTKTDPLDFLMPLAMGLKQVKDNAFNALKPVESLLAAFTNKKTQKDAFNLFDGIQNRLLRMGVGEELRGAVESMSAEDFSKVAALTGDRALFTFAKGKPRSKDTITGLTKTGKAVDQGYREKNLGDFNLANEETVKNIQDQTKAYNILIANGLTAGQALDVVADKGQAAAIASGAIAASDPDWKKYIKNITTSSTSLERQAVLTKAIRANQEFEMYKNMPELVSQMNKLGYSTEQIDAVLGDPELAKVLMEDLKNGKLQAGDIADYLNNIEAKKIIDIQVQLNQGKFDEAAELGRDIVDEMFAAEEGLIRTGIDANKIRVNDDLISDLEAKIDPFVRKVEGITEEVNDLNRVLETSPLFGDRLIQTIQDENDRLSNDLTVISNAAEEVNKKYDDQAEALSKVQEINADIVDQQKQQLDLADALTSGDISAAARAVQNIRAASAEKFASAQSDALQRARQNALGSLVNKDGLNEEQITKKQYENSQKIYAMENDPRRIAILNSIKTKQDEIYNIEENDIEPLQSQIDELVDLNKLYQANIDKQIAAIKVFGKTRSDWDSVNARIDYYAAAQKALNNPEALAGLVEAAGRLDGVWKDINAKMEAYKTGVPDSVKDAQKLIGKDKTESSTDRAAREKAEADKAEADKKVAALALALRKLTVGATLTDEEKSLVAGSRGDTGSRGRSGGRFGTVQTLASGGFVPSVFKSGGYAKGTDTVPAMLTPGEYVLRKDAVKRYGVDNLDAMNVGYYGFGGLVKSIFKNRFVKSAKIGGLSTGIYQAMEEIEKTLSLKYGSNRSSSEVAKWSTAIGRASFNIAQHGLSGLPVGGYGGLVGLGTGLIDGVAALIREGSDYGLKGGKYANKQGSKATHRGFDPKKELDNMSVGQSLKNTGKSVGLGALFGVGGTAVGLGIKKFLPNILKHPLTTKVSSILPKVSSFALPKLIAKIKSKAGIEPSAWEKAYAIAGQQATAGGFTPIESLLGASHATLLREIEALVPHSGTFIAPKSGIEYAFKFRPGKASEFPAESTLLKSIEDYAAAPYAYSEKLGPSHIIEVTRLGTNDGVASLTWDSVTGSIGGAYTRQAFQEQGIMRWLNEYAGSLTRLKHSAWRTDDGKGYSAAVGGIMPDKAFIDKPLPINLAILEALKTSGLDSIFETRIGQVTANTSRSPASQRFSAEMAAAEEARLKATAAATAAARLQASKESEAAISAWRTDPNRTYNSYPYFKNGGSYIDPQDLNELSRLQAMPDTPAFREPTSSLIFPLSGQGKIFSDGPNLADQLSAVRYGPDNIYRRFFEESLISQIGAGAIRRGDDGILYYKAKGGIIPEKFVSGGYSSGTDTVPAMLTPGEYVLRKDAVEKYGVKNLDAMNVGYYHTGGPVGHRHGRNAPATPNPSRDSGGFFGSIGRFFSKGDRDATNGGPTNNSWLDRYARSRTETDKRTQATLDKSPLTSWMAADVLGMTGFLKTITGQATTADKFNGIFFPLNFLGIGKFAGEGTKAAAPALKGTGGFLSKLGSQFSKSIAAPVSRVSSKMFGSIKAAGSKVIAPLKELFLPAANPNYNIKNSFLEGLERGAPRMGFAQDPAAIKAINKKMEPLVAKLNAAGYVQHSRGGEFMLQGTHTIPYSPKNAIEQGHPLYDTILAISKLELELMAKSTKPAKNFGYYASVAGSLVKKAKDKIQEILPVLSGRSPILPGQISEKALKIGARLDDAAPDGVGTGINETFRATLDGVAGFYKRRIVFAEVQREVFGSIFARAAKLIAPENIPIIRKGKDVADGIFSPDVAAQGAQTLKALKTQAGNPDGSFDRLADAATATQSGYRAAIMQAMRFVDDHDGNLTVNPETGVTGLIDFGRILDYAPHVPTVDEFANRLQRTFFTYGVPGKHSVFPDAWKDPKITGAFFSGVDKGLEFLKTLKEKDIIKMLEAAGYEGKQLKEQAALVIESIRVTGLAAVRAADDLKVKQGLSNVQPSELPQNPAATGATDWLLGLGKNPPVAGPPPLFSNAQAPGVTDWMLGLGGSLKPSIPFKKTPTNPLKVAALTLGGGATGLASILWADPDLSSVKITENTKTKPKGGSGGRGNMLALSRGGMVPKYFAQGGYSIGTDTVPAMLTPGEFVMSKYAVDKYGVDNMKSINSGSSVGDSVYNYNLNLNVKSDANPDEIARAVMVQIKSVDAQRIRGSRI